MTRRPTLRPTHQLAVKGHAAGRYGAPPSWFGGAIVTALVAQPAVAAHFWPGFARALEYDRDRVLSGEFWRLVTCHWPHFSLPHLGFDLFAFVVLMTLCWQVCRDRLLTALASSAALIPLAVLALLPSMTGYRGLSGIDSALYVLLGVTLLRQELAAGDKRRAALFGLALVAFAAKIGFEIATGSAFFAASEAFVPVPLAHVVGALCGLAAALPLFSEQRSARVRLRTARQ